MIGDRWEEESRGFDIPYWVWPLSSVHGDREEFKHKS